MEADSGQISIDGIDVSTLGLQELRRKFTVLPQDVVLFNGTVRTNLTLANLSESTLVSKSTSEEVSDLELYEILRKVNLIPRPSLLKSGTPSSTSLVPNPAMSVHKLSTDTLSSSIESSTTLAKKTSFKLDDAIVEHGGNISFGQRQLLALGRALLHLQSSSILLIDEATSSIGKLISIVSEKGAMN